MDLKDWEEFLGEFDFDEQEEFERFDLFRYSIWRSCGLLTLQNIIGRLAEFEENPVYQEYFSAIGQFFEEKEERLMELPDNDINSNREEISSFLSFFAEFGMSLELVSKRPLYSEAVVSSVTAFETFLKSSIVYLVSEFEEIEKRFTPELDKELSYGKIKEFDYERELVLGYVVAGTINFYEMEQVDNAFKRAFGMEDEKGLSFFSSKKAKQKLQRFISIRHLIVHKGGFVDSKFKKKTNCAEEIGEEYLIEREYIEEMLKEMFHTASEIEDYIKRIEQGA